jgi:predicted deacylase
MSTPTLLAPPNIARWRDGNLGIEFAHRRGSGELGPHALITALMHGNEACGAVALDRLLAAEFSPARGALTLAFLNVAAFRRIDPRKQDQGRFVDEDMNRVWSRARLDGPGHTVELERARQVRPLVDAADFLLDLHSMTEGTVPLALCGTTDKGARFARQVGFPATIVADPGHAGGVRLRDYDAFGQEARGKAALLVECGLHFDARSAEVAFETALRFLAALDMLDPAFAAKHLPPTPPAPQRLIEVTHVVTIETDRFTFARPWRSLDVVPAVGTLLARDGEREVRTPYDDCVLIMPTRKLERGLTAVRLGRTVADATAP